MEPVETDLIEPVNAEFISSITESPSYQSKCRTYGRVQKPSACAVFERPHLDSQSVGRQCPLVCPKPRRIVPCQSPLVSMYEIERFRKLRESGYFFENPCELNFNGSCSSFKGSWLTFDDVSSTTDFSDPTKPLDSVYTEPYNKSDIETSDCSPDIGFSDCCLGNTHRAETRNGSSSESCSLSSSFKSYFYLNPEKSKCSLMSECTSSSSNIEDFESPSFGGEKAYEGELKSVLPARTENPMVRDAWFLLSSQGSSVNMSAKKDAIKQALECDWRHNRLVYSNRSKVIRKTRTPCFRLSPALSV